MKNLIFSVYYDIDNIDIDHNKKQTNTKSQLKKYFDKLVDNKKQYAKICDADFELIADFDTKISFDNLQFQKIFLLEELVKDYDNILYLDLDVVVNTNKNFFKKFDMNTICCKSFYSSLYNEYGLKNSDYNHISNDIENEIKNLDRYHWVIKGYTKEAMMKYHDIFKETNLVINTAIVGGGKEAISKLKFYENFSSMCDIIEQLKKDELYPDYIREKFDMNNEVFFTYLLEKNKLPFTDLPQWWHQLILKETSLKCTGVSQAQMLHIIDKNFKRIF